APLAGAKPLVTSVFCPDPPDYSVGITTDGSSPSWTEGTTGHTAQFTVQNGPCSDSYDFSYTATGPVSAVTLNKTGSGLPANGSTTVIATYSVDNPGTGQLTLIAKAHLGGESAENGYLVTTTLPAGAPVVDASAIAFLEQDYSRCANSCFAALTSRA